MYQEEYLPDDASIDHEYVLDDSDETSSGVDTEINERRRINREYKKLDKHYYCINYSKNGKTYKTKNENGSIYRQNIPHSWKITHSFSRW